MRNKHTPEKKNNNHENNKHYGGLGLKTTKDRKERKERKEYDTMHHITSK